MADWINRYLEYTSETEPPYLFKEWTAMSCIAAALQRKCFLELGIVKTYPNLFIALVGPSGTGKSLAMRPGRDMLRSLGIKIAAESITREALIRELRKSYEDHVDPVEGTIYSHSSLTVHSSELAVFIGFQNRQMISDLCDLYDCDDRWEYRTKDITKTDEIIGVFLNIEGGITPSLIQATLPPEAIGGGLTARMICVYEEKGSKIVPIFIMTNKYKQLREQLTNDLADINQMQGAFKVTPDFIDHWVDWYTKSKFKHPFESKQFDGYFTRRPLHILKMCMIISASESTDMIITSKILGRAINLLNRTERNMPKTFAGVGESKLSVVLSSVMSYIGTQKSVTYKELNNRFHQDADKKTMEEVIKQLQIMEFCKVVNGKDIIYTYKEDTLGGNNQK